MPRSKGCVNLGIVAANEAAPSQYTPRGAPQVLWRESSIQRFDNEPEQGKVLPLHPSCPWTAQSTIGVATMYTCLEKILGYLERKLLSILNASTSQPKVHDNILQQVCGGGSNAHNNVGGIKQQPIFVSITWKSQQPSCQSQNSSQ